MKLRSFSAAFLVLMLIMGLFSSTLAENTAVSSFELEARDVVFNQATNTIGVLKKDASTYVLMDAAGNELTTEPYIYMDEEEMFFQVTATEDTNGMGLIDGLGNEVMPMQYGDIDCISDRWLLGVVLAEATADNYDYKSLFGGAFYLVDHYDLYFKGAMVGSFERLEYKNATAYGDYIFIRDAEGNYSAYDSEMNQSAYEFEYQNEYDDDYKNDAVYHIASNQQAFTAGCTLTEDEVKQSIWYDSGKFYDLQGNVLFEEQSRYDYVADFVGDYTRVKVGNYVGLIDREGNEVIPCEYDEISCNDVYFASGYQVVVKDSKLGYVNLKGEVTCDFVYDKSVGTTYSSPFNQIKNLDGTIILLSGAAGELPVHYKEVARSFVDTCPLAAVVNTDGLGGVIDMYGNEVVAFDGAYDSMYDFDISDDGTLIVCDKGSRMYSVLSIANE